MVIYYIISIKGKVKIITFFNNTYSFIILKNIFYFKFFLALVKSSLDFYNLTQLLILDEENADSTNLIPFSAVSKPNEKVDSFFFLDKLSAMSS